MLHDFLPVMIQPAGNDTSAGNKLSEDGAAENRLTSRWLSSRAGAQLLGVKYLRPFDALSYGCRATFRISV
jgi:hypothetical protein